MSEIQKRGDPIPELVTRGLPAEGYAGNSLPGPKVVQVTLGSGAGAGALLAWQNPEDVEVFASLVVDITTVSGGVATADFGVAANGTTLSDTLLDGMDINAAKVNNGAQHIGTNGLLYRKVSAKGGATAFITGSVATGVVGAMVGKAYIIYTPIA